MCKSTDVIELLLQSSFRNPIEFYYNWIVILHNKYDVWCVMTRFYIMSSSCIYVYWHGLHLMASLEIGRLYEINNYMMMIGHDMIFILFQRSTFGGNASRYRTHQYVKYVALIHSKCFWCLWAYDFLGFGQ
jgi:hypothetical protein